MTDLAGLARRQMNLGKGSPTSSRQWNLHVYQWPIKEQQTHMTFEEKEDLLWYIEW